MSELKERIEKYEKHIQSFKTSIVMFERELEELKTRSSKEDEKESYGLWRPCPEETYWYVDKYEAEDTTYAMGCEFDDKAIATGNCFQTKDLCEDYIRFKTVETKVRDIALRLNAGVKIDWCNKNQEKYSIYFDYHVNTITLNSSADFKDAGVIYCLSSDFKDICIKEINIISLKSYLWYEL